MKILLVDDNEADLVLVSYALRGVGRDFVCARSRLELVGALNSTGFDAAIIDYWLPEMPWPVAKEMIRAKFPDCIVVVISGAVSETQQGYDAIRDGADDYIDKSRMDVLPHVLRREMIRRMAKHDRADAIAILTQKESK